MLNIEMGLLYTKTDLVFGFSSNQILVAVIPGLKNAEDFPRTKGAEDFTRSILSRILSENHYEMSILHQLFISTIKYNRRCCNISCALLQMSKYKTC